MSIPDVRSSLTSSLARAGACLLLGVLVACGGGSKGGGGGGGTPTPTNRAPSIASMSISPSFGVAQLTGFTMTGSGSDADGDQLTYTWDFGDNSTASGASATHTFPGSGPYIVRLTASDGRITGSDTRTVDVGSMSGRWRLTTTACNGMNQDFTMTLTQSGGTITGTFEMPDGFCAAARGTTGRTDPAEPGTINAAGRVVIRFKVGRFIDFYFRGDMQAPGNRVVGGVFNSGLQGQSTTLEKL